MAELWDTLAQLIANLWTLSVILLNLAFRWALVIAWVVWWLFAVDWKKAWSVLARGGWAPAVLLIIVAALVWSRLDESPTAPGDFWWRLGGVSLLAAVALLCGWLQGVFGIQPPAVAVEPVVAHEHPVGTLHGHLDAHNDDHRH
jgi:hypothetical protein